MTNLHVDVSEHQTSVFTNAYPRSFGMFRAASEYDRPDAKAPGNLAWCVHARATGKLVNFGVYVIPGNVPNDAVTGRLDALGVPADCVIMLDAESWGGLVTGDHSVQFNTLADAIRARQGGRADLVWGYLNPNVDADLWPSRPPWLGFIQPAYGPATPPDPRGLNRIGWQYCNAVQNGTGYPSASAPFGRCDHNVMYVNYPPQGDPVSATGPEHWDPADWSAIRKNLPALADYDPANADKPSVATVLHVLEGVRDGAGGFASLPSVQNALAAAIAELQQQVERSPTLSGTLNVTGALNMAEQTP